MMLKTPYEVLIEKTQKKISQLRVRIDDARNKIISYSELYASREAELARLEESPAYGSDAERQREIDIAAMKGHMESFAEEIADIEKEIDTLSAEIDALEEELATERKKTLN